MESHRSKRYGAFVRHKTFPWYVLAIEKYQTSAVMSNSVARTVLIHEKLQVILAAFGYSQRMVDRIDTAHAFTL